MADISKIVVPSGDEYDIKDSTSRSGLADKMDKTNPTGTGSFSLNRKANTTVGMYSTTEGYDNTASGTYSHAEGHSNTASGNNSHAEGAYNTASAGYAHVEGNETTASALAAHAEGYGTTASATGAHVEGHRTKASSAYQHVFGKYNIEDTAATYAEIVGNGSSSTPSNARTLDWSGNEVLAGDLTINGSTSVGTALGVIGDTEVAATSGSNPITIPNSTYTECVHIAIPKGRYIIIGMVGFASNAEGYRGINCSTTSGDSGIAAARLYTNAVSGNQTRMQTIYYVETTQASSTIYLNVYQNSGGNLNVVYSMLRSVRLA